MRILFIRDSECLAILGWFLVHAVFEEDAGFENLKCGLDTSKRLRALRIQLLQLLRAIRIQLLQLLRTLRVIRRYWFLTEMRTY
ncbi:unnamed protein product [Cercopithifilaria johnstoni]|uniref:Uncharacterized protein n=1 Tax=Cercopithifilaria johnstoni TaxID=2874296 RepID=A0A8J2M5B3_9BILA|nr:unnamed protein product [Cercopithifilaria johnstoni]